MHDGFRCIKAEMLKAQLHDGQEIALLDAREEATFDKRHLFMASCVPLSRLEMIVNDLVPRRSTRVVWCDNGEGVAARAAGRMSALGYTDVSLLDGGLTAWEQAGYRVYHGVHVPSKAFAEVVEHAAHTPWITAEQLKGMIDRGEDIIIFDSRSYSSRSEPARDDARDAPRPGSRPSAGAVLGRHPSHALSLTPDHGAATSPAEVRSPACFMSGSTCSAK